MKDNPVDLDKHRGMAAQKATDIRRVLADVEANAKLLRDVEIQLLAVAATSWSEAAAKARYILNLYAADLAPVSAIVSQSLRNASSTQHAQQTIEGRLLALGQAHDLLLQAPWTSADLR